MEIKLTEEQADTMWDILNEKRNEILDNSWLPNEVRIKKSDKIAEIMRLLEK